MLPITIALYVAGKSVDVYCFTLLQQHMLLMIFCLHTFTPASSVGMHAAAGRNVCDQPEHVLDYAQWHSTSCPFHSCCWLYGGDITARQCCKVIAAIHGD